MTINYFDSTVADPELYERVATPHANVNVAKENADAFYKGVCELREKYGITEFVIAFTINAKKEDGEVYQLVHTGYRGGKFTDFLILRLLNQTRIGKFVHEMTEEYIKVMFV